MIKGISANRTSDGASVPEARTRAENRRARRRRERALAGIVATVVALTIGACGRHDPAAKDDTPGAPVEERAPASVTTVRVTAADGGTIAVLPGRVEAREEISVVAKIPARLSRLAVAEGQPFREGDLLAVFAAPETQKALIASRAGVEAAARQCEIARLQEARIDSLYAARVATRRELETAQAARRGAEAELAAAEAALSSLSADTEVRAPFDGVVVRRRVDSGASVLPGTPLLDIRSVAIGGIVAPVPESVVEALAASRLDCQIGSGAWRETRLLRLDGMVDPATRTRTARFAPGDSGAALQAGAFARVRVSARDGERPNDDGRALASVPTESVVRRGGLRGVFVVREGRAHLRWIRAGREIGASTEVLAGLSAGDEVVLAPAGLADGQRVHAAAATPPPISSGAGAHSTEGIR